MPNAPATTAAYFAQLPNDRETGLLALRALMFGIWPHLFEDMGYGMPTYHLDGQPLFALASHKHHMVFYVIPYDLLQAFKHELLLHNCGKSCIRLKHTTPDALFLIERIVRYIGATHADSRVSLKPMLRT